MLKECIDIFSKDHHDYSTQQAYGWNKQDLGFENGKDDQDHGVIGKVAGCADMGHSGEKPYFSN